MNILWTASGTVERTKEWTNNRSHVDANADYCTEIQSSGINLNHSWVEDFPQLTEQIQLIRFSMALFHEKLSAIHKDVPSYDFKATYSLTKLYQALPSHRILLSSSPLNEHYLISFDFPLLREDSLNLKRFSSVFSL